MKLRIHPSASRVAALSLVALAAADPAFAQVTSGAGSFIDNLIEWLRSDIIRGLAILAVMVTGAACLAGRLEWGRAGWVLGGIAVMFGAREIVEMLSGGGT